MNVSGEFKTLFARDLGKLKEEINLYASEEQLWITDGEIKNSAGNLAMHLCGNLQHFIGHVLGGSAYERDRAFEFNGRMTREALVSEVLKTEEALIGYFETASDEDYSADYPLEVFGYKMSNLHFIMHLMGHLNYHLGQVNYHRRILGK